MSGVLADVRVLDLSGITAGGRTAQILGDYGADVIKVEGPTRPDPFRHWTAVTGESGRGDLGSTPFRVVSRNRRGIAVDLKNPASRDIMRRLVERSDIVVENFRRGVLARLGLSFDVLCGWNPSTVLLTLSSQGESGPESGYVSFGSTLEALGGMMSLTGYPSSPPTWSTNKVNYPDQIVSVLAPGLALHALMESRRVGRGRWINLAQREAVTAMLGEFVVRASVTGTSPRPRGNIVDGSWDVCSPCAGDDEWVAVTVDDHATWAALAATVDRHDLAAAGGAKPWTDDSMAAAMSTALHEWTATRTKHEAMARLQKGGVAAAAVQRAWEVAERAVRRGERWYEQVPLPDGGYERHLSWPVDIEPDAGPAIRRRAPHVGEHTHEILAEIGYQPDEIEALFASGVVSDRVTA